MSIFDENDLTLQCKNQIWVRARVIVDTKSLGSFAYDINFLMIFNNKPEIFFHQKILKASN